MRWTCKHEVRWKTIKVRSVTCLRMSFKCMRDDIQYMVRCMQTYDKRWRCYEMKMLMHDHVFYVTYQDEWTYKHVMKWEWDAIRSEWICYNAYKMVKLPISEHISKHDEHWGIHDQTRSNKQHKKFNFEYMIKTWKMDASLT